MQEYPKWLLEQRNQVNKLLSNQIKIAVKNKYLTSEIKRCVLPGRKVRSILFLNTVKELNVKVSPQKIQSIVLSIELSHAASVLIDDVIDSDQYRHGHVATEVEWGHTKSILFAHLLTGIAIENLIWQPDLQKELINIYQDMSQAEMYDVFIPPGDWILKGYNSKVYKKTSRLFGFALSAAHILSGAKQLNCNLEIIGQQLGILYQLSNDYYDMQPLGITERHAKTQSWPITFSFPLSVYLHKYGKDKIEPYLAQRILTYQQWLEFTSVIWKESVKKECENKIRSVQQNLSKLVCNSNYPVSIKNMFNEFIDLIVTQNFWYHVYQIS